MKPSFAPPVRAPPLYTRPLCGHRAILSVHEHRRKVELRRRVPNPGDPLPPVRSARVEHHLEARACLQALDHERRRRRDSVGAPADALVGAGVRNVGEVAKVGVLVDSDVEELAETAVLLVVVLADRPAGAEDAGELGVHGHLLGGPADEGEPVAVALPTLLAFPDLLALRLGSHGHDDLAVVDLQPELDQLAHRTRDLPHLAFAEVVGASDGHVRCRGLRPGGVDQLHVVGIARELELLLAADADLARVRPDAVLANQVIHAARAPGAEHLVPVRVARGLRDAVRRNLLPRDLLPALAPEELDPVERARGDLLVPPVDHPALVRGVLVRVRPLHPDVLAGLVAHRPELVVRDTVDGDDEGLAARLAQGDRELVGAVLLLLHVLPAPEAAPGTHDGDLNARRIDQLLAILDLFAPVPEAALVGQRRDVVGLELVAEAVCFDLPAVIAGGLAGQVVDRCQSDGASHGDLLDSIHVQLSPARDVGADAAEAPDLRVGVGARDTEGGHADQTGLLVVGARLADHVGGPAGDVQVRVQRPHVAVGQPAAVLGHEDALEEPGRAGVGLQVADVALGTG
mmetsp:Transcript_92463/g.245577  ORF Transcript_92463/g.245577 Transcript_92463/m.245577 type:complete len:573 (+) Transcript_92463:2-1720(+)